jgi:hypothetical protein
MPGITLVAYGAGTVVVKAMLKDATRKAKKVDAMAASKILLLSQSAYVLRMKKHSEKTTDTIPIPESILANTRHLLGLSFGVKFIYRFVVRRINGRYRVATYRPVTLFQCDRSKNDHSS